MNNIEYKIPDDLMDLARRLVKTYDVMYQQWEPIVNSIIDKKATNKNTIEKCLDMIMDLHTDKGYQLFLKLCNYYATIDEYAANEYLKMYDELYGEEESKMKTKSYKK